VKRLVPLFAVACVAASALSATSVAANRMWVGFHDDPVLRFDGGRQEALDRARQNGATIVRTLVEWHRVAPTRPANPRDPFDPAYRFDDLDEFVRNAQQRDMEVLITLWGTPPWANGGRKPQFMPRRWSDFQAFAQAVASRYSGRFAGYPSVGHYGIWNESNLGTFLQPQFNNKGKIVSPTLYARLAAAGIAGIKAGNGRALIAIGETSSNGRDRKRPGLTDTVAPATFMKGVARANKRLKFAAWAQHPYPFPVSQKPTQKLRYPNVGLTSLKRFEKDLDKAFGRKNIPVWITEYGHETKPGEPKGVTESVQASYVRQALTIARKDQRVQMFVWFVMQDSQGSLWQSGIYRADGSAKPSRPVFQRTATPLDATNAVLRVRGGATNPVATVHVRSFCANNPIGTTVGTTTRVLQRTTLVGVQQAALPLGLDCAVRVRLPVKVVKKKSYRAEVQLNTANGGLTTRTITVVGV
jgi:Cellulase (glycosyl hydrolase family 5)